jgi:protein prenyltransferase alpha subunit repeat containing protein 1
MISDIDCQSIALEIDSIFDSDTLLNEFDWVIAPDDVNIIHIDHKLGINAKALKSLFCYAIRKLFQSGDVLEENAIEISDTIVQLYTKILLLVNSDNYVAFNSRRRLIMKGVINPSNELRFLNVLFTKHSKSPIAWSHRRFCIHRLHPNGLDNSLQVSELHICSQVSEKFPRNYYAWIHRCWILDQMTNSEMVSFLTTYSSKFTFLPQ